MTHKNTFRLASDIGGTFTDTVLIDANETVVATTKTPTTPKAPAEGALLGAQHVMRAAGIKWHQVSGKIHGTTLATNALIERRGAKVATITTGGFRDILEIAYERRYSQYAINIEKPNLLVPRQLSYTIAGRMNAAGEELISLDTTAIPALAAELRRQNVQAVAVCLMHAYANPAHEQTLGTELRKLLPGVEISLSHEVSPEAREFDRLCTTIANAYIQPLMKTYLSDFEARFMEQGLTCPILMMTAGGGMTTLETAARLPIRLVESGPAGGAILAARIAKEISEKNVLSFDMGGTTAKLCLIDNYRPQTARKFEISRAERFIKGSGMPVRIPVIEMIEIGAGGGSIATVDRLNRLQIGPESAGSEPGPVAFGKGGTEPTVTDADIAMGLIEPSRFAEGRLTINGNAAATAIDDEIAKPLEIDAQGAAFAISEIVDENMASAGRMHAVESGKDISSRLMIAFGGNGPLHATRVARRAQVGRILIPNNPGVGSAVGFLYAPVSFEIIRSRYTTLDDLDPIAINVFLNDLETEAVTVVRSGAAIGDLGTRRVAFMRYHGQGHEIEIELPNSALTLAELAHLKNRFELEYSRQFSRIVPGMTIEILNWGVTVSSHAPTLKPATQTTENRIKEATEFREITCDVSGSKIRAGVFDRADLRSGDQIIGPALIIEAQTTTLVSVDFSALIDLGGNIWMTQTQEAMK